MKQYTVKLKTGDSVLKGKYPSGVLVIVYCDATNGSFTLNLPDCGSIVDTMFRLIREDEDSSMDVTVTPYGTQKINGETSQNLRVGTVIDLTTDRLNWS